MRNAFINISSLHRSALLRGRLGLVALVSNLLVLLLIGIVITT